MASKNSDRSLANLTALADHQRCLMLHSIDSTVLAASPRPARVVAIDDTAKIIKDVMRVNALLGDIFDLTATPVERIRGIVHCAIDEGELFRVVQLMELMVDKVSLRSRQTLALGG